MLTLALLAATLIRDTNFGWRDQLANFAPMALAAMASTPAIISGGGGFDLSISPLMYLTGEVFIVWLATDGLGGAVSVPIVLAVGLAIGALNGLLIILLRVPPVVATLSMYFVLIGVDLRVAPNPKYLGENWIHELAGSVEIAGLGTRGVVHARLPDRGLGGARADAVPAHALRRRLATMRRRSRAASTSPPCV